MLRRILACGAVVALAASAAFAQEEKESLDIGDKAPTIEVEHWLKGDEVVEFEKGKVYVVEFWATWCPPCRASMPHISKLQSEYKDYGVQFIGISDEELATVKNFIAAEEWDEKTKYTIATDPDKSVYGDYMTAAGEGGIPTAFIVGKEGHIEWIGHPMMIDDPIDRVVHGKWNREAAKAERALGKELQEAAMAADHELTVEILDKLIARVENPGRYQLHKARLLITELDRTEEGYKLLEIGVKSVWDNPQFLNQIAWEMVAEPGYPDPDLDLALKIAERACELSENKSGMILDTLARVHYEKGDLKKAIEIQKKAVEFAEEGFEELLQETLDQYVKEGDGG